MLGRLARVGQCRGKVWEGHPTKPMLVEGTCRMSGGMVLDGSVGVWWLGGVDIAGGCRGGLVLVGVYWLQLAGMGAKTRNVC